nr:LacI family DNA-binding transcriptional regulator [Bifidobacterium miconis]
MNEDVQNGVNVSGEPAGKFAEQTPRVTITDVAKEAGVSPSTVSRAFARPGRVNAQTAQRIREAADRLGYRSTAVPVVSDGLRMTGQIAFVVSDLGNPIFANYVKSAQHEALKRGYSLLVIDSEESDVVERRAVEFVRDHVDGIVLGSSRRSDAAIRKLAETVPVITINRPIRGVRSVISDVRGGLGSAVGRLLDLGHRRIAYVSGPEQSWQNGVRWQTLLTMSRAQGFAVRRIPSESPTYAGGFRAVQDVLSSSCTAVVAYNDLIAIGLTAALTARGVRVPDRISIVGIDDIPTSSLIAPKLSTVRLNGTKVAARAVGELIDGLRRVPAAGDYKPIFVDSVFISRESVVPPAEAVGA